MNIMPSYLSNANPPTYSTTLAVPANVAETTLTDAIRDPLIEVNGSARFKELLLFLLTFPVIVPQSVPYVLR
jgi:hypothetical protein